MVFSLIPAKMSKCQNFDRRSKSSSSANSGAGPQLRKSIKPRAISEGKIIENDHDKIAKLDELIRRNSAAIQMNEIHTKHVKLEIQEQQLRENVIKLQELKGKFELILKEEQNYDKVLRHSQMIFQVLSNSKDAEQFAKTFEQYFTERIPFYLDEEQFKTISDNIQIYDFKLGQYEKIDSVREFLESFAELTTNNGMVDVCQPETYQQIKNLNSKSNEQIERLSDLPESIRSLQQILSWVYSNKPNKNSENHDQK